MFSLFEGGIKNTTPTKLVTIEDLIELIKSNSELKSDVRSSFQNDQKEFNKLKILQDFITPTGVFNSRKKGKYILQKSSSYIYLDIDLKNKIFAAEDIKKYKEKIIEEYGCKITLLSTSSSGFGFSILCKISNEIIDENHLKNVLKYVRLEVFKGLETDPACTDLIRPMFISFDENPYYNPNSIIDISDKKIARFCNIMSTEIKILCSKSEQVSQKKSKSHRYSSDIDIKDVLSYLTTATTVETTNEIIDIKSIKYCEVFHKSKIEDNKKRKLYSVLINKLYHLNSHLENIESYILSYINFINTQYADPRMEYSKMIDLFYYTINQIKENPEYEFTYFDRVKHVHFNNNYNIDGITRSIVTKKINGLIRRNKTIKLVIDAKRELINQNRKITLRKVSSLINKNPSVISKYYNLEEEIDLKIIENYINNNGCEEFLKYYDKKFRS